MRLRLLRGCVHQMRGIRLIYLVQSGGGRLPLVTYGQQLRGVLCRRPERPRVGRRHDDSERDDLGGSIFPEFVVSSPSVWSALRQLTADTFSRTFITLHVKYMPSCTDDLNGAAFPSIRNALESYVSHRGVICTRRLCSSSLTKPLLRDTCAARVTCSVEYNLSGTCTLRTAAGRSSPCSHAVLVVVCPTLILTDPWCADLRRLLCE